MIPQKNKSAQEEIVGFALIIIIIAIILLVLLVFSLNKPEKEAVESFEVGSFINTFLQYTTDCAETYEPNYANVQKLISNCNSGEFCLDGRNACEALNSTLNNIIKKSWKTGEESPIKGYELKIISSGVESLILKDGNETNNYKSDFVSLSGSGKPEVYFSVYY